MKSPADSLQQNQTSLTTTDFAYSIKFSIPAPYSAPPVLEVSLPALLLIIWRGEKHTAKYWKLHMHISNPRITQHSTAAHKLVSILSSPTTCQAGLFLLSSFPHISLPATHTQDAFPKAGNCSPRHQLWVRAGPALQQHQHTPGATLPLPMPHGWGAATPGHPLPSAHPKLGSHQEAPMLSVPLPP